MAEHSLICSINTSESAHLHICTFAHRRRVSFRATALLLFSLLFLATSCERRQQIISEGDYIDVDSTVLHWKEYLRNDTFVREVTKNKKVINIAQSKTEKDFRDSTFSETDFYYSNGQPKATRVFEKGKQQGVWKSWYEDGTTKSSSLVNDGELRDYFSYYDNGAIAVTASRAPDGTMSRTERWRNGNLKEEFLTDSLGNGKCTNYHMNGKKSQEGALYRFAPVETWQRWDSLGNSMADTSYGKPVIF